MFHAQMFYLWGVVETMVRVQLQDIRQIIIRLDRAQSLHEVSANENSAVGGFSSPSGDGRGSSAASASSSQSHIVD